MMLTRLIYTSRITAPLSDATLQELLETAQPNNAKNNITGVLLVDSGYFMQYIEGPSQNVNRLYRALLADSRHEDPTLLYYSTVPKRLFEGWDMAFLPEGIGEALQLSDYAPQMCDNFKPYALSSHGAFRMITDYWLAVHAGVGGNEIRHKAG